MILTNDFLTFFLYPQIPLMCEDSERKDQLLKLVPQIVKSGEKIIIFALDHECFELQSVSSIFIFEIRIINHFKHLILNRIAELRLENCSSIMN